MNRIIQVLFWLALVVAFAAGLYDVARRANLCGCCRKVERSVLVRTEVICEECDGTGETYGPPINGWEKIKGECPICMGSGRLIEERKK